jgi:hypothetical protein
MKGDTHGSEHSFKAHRKGRCANVSRIPRVQAPATHSQLGSRQPLRGKARMKGMCWECKDAFCVDIPFYITFYDVILH